MVPILGYWKLRGIANPIRFMLEYVDIQYEEKKYEIGDGPEFDRSDWENEKFELGLPFPNLPYYIDGDVKITQNLAIIKYVARQHNLLGKAEDIYMFDMIENHIMETRIRLGLLCYGSDYDAKYNEFIEIILPPLLNMIYNFLGEKKWLFNELTYLDFLLYELLAVSIALDSNAIAAFPKFKELMTKFENLDNIKTYMASSRFIKYPFHGPMAKLG